MKNNLRMLGANIAFVAVACLLILTSARVAFSADDAIVVTVSLPGKSAIAFTAADLSKLPRTTATLERDGEKVPYEGVLLYDLLLKAYGVPAGKPLPINALRSELGTRD